MVLNHNISEVEIKRDKMEYLRIILYYLYRKITLDKNAPERKRWNSNVCRFAHFIVILGCDSLTNSLRVEQ